MSLKAAQIQLLLLRVYLGLDFTNHFAEKFGLLGPGPKKETVENFARLLGPEHAYAMMIVAGLCEFASFVGLTFGVLTRFAACGSALYLFIALMDGHHFSNGFGWANAGGGGWEFPLLWTVFCLSFVIAGGGPWSLDGLLRDRVPRGVRWLFS
jgi:putative oxidoreductase